LGSCWVAGRRGSPRSSPTTSRSPRRGGTSSSSTRTPPSIGCELNDGSYLGGELFTYNSDEDETGDRELALSSPITYRAAGDDPVDLEDVGAVSVSARQIKFLTVSYLPVDDEDASDE